MRRASFALLLVSFVAACAPDAQESFDASLDRPPNFVVVFADDLGWGDLGSYGAPVIRTPHLDRMAAEGQRWTNFYVTASVCSPSRAGLLTGRLPVRNGLYGDQVRVLFPGFVGGIQDEEITLAEALRDLGYATGMFGKWHLGDGPRYLPTRHGFDYWFGIPYSNDMMSTLPREERRAAFLDPKIEYWDVPLIRSERDEAGEIVTETLEQPADQTTITKRYAEEAVEFIRAHRDEPFFVYLPHSMPHVPLFRAPGFEDHSGAGLYGDVIEEIDWSVGRILDTLEEEGIAGNTVVFFSSDNGPWTAFRTQGGLAGPLREGKGMTWDGGMRVPGLFWWPGTIAPEVVTNEIGSTSDLFATFLSLSGGAVPDDRPMDSLDLAPVLRGDGEGPREEVPFYRGSELYAYRVGNYKAHFVTEGEYGLAGERREHDPPLLYDLALDPGEQWDIAADRPEILADVISRALQHRAGVAVAPSEFDLRTGR
ncbi:MAG: sulfatase [Holophagales bacterium]|nr:sulfatase [Holophagales bacterium]MYC09782.1 sulfatase [Holophagales bacterium]